MADKPVDNLNVEDLDDDNDGDDGAGGGDDKNKKSELRQYITKLEKENSDFRAQLVGQHLGSIGLDPEKGLGKAIAKEFKGDVSLDAIAEFAKAEYGHEAEVAETPPAVATAQRTEQLAQVGSPVTPQAPPNPVEQKEQKLAQPDATRQDAQQSIAAKVGQFTETFYGPGGPSAPPQQ